jgi:hypothetical protein
MIMPDGDRRLKWQGKPEQRVTAAVGAEPEKMSLPAWRLYEEELTIGDVRKVGSKLRAYHGLSFRILRDFLLLPLLA